MKILIVKIDKLDIKELFIYKVHSPHKILDYLLNMY